MERTNDMILRPSVDINKIIRMQMTTTDVKMMFMFSLLIAKIN